MVLKNISIITIFASDCVETLEEISIQGKESFEKSGEKNLDLWNVSMIMMIILN